MWVSRPTDNLYATATVCNASRNLKFRGADECRLERVAVMQGMELGTILIAGVSIRNDVISESWVVIGEISAMIRINELLAGAWPYAEQRQKRREVVRPSGTIGTRGQRPKAGLRMTILTGSSALPPIFPNFNLRSICRIRLTRFAAGAGE